MARLEIVPDNLDVVEFGCVFWQPLDGEPVFARLDGFKSELAAWIGSLSSTSTTGLCPSWLRTEQVVELLEVSDEVAAALGLARMHTQLARDMIECRLCHFLGLTPPAPAGPTAQGPRPRQIRVRQGLALVAVEEDDVAGFGLSLAQLKAQSHAFDLGRNLAAFQRVPGPPPTEVFFRNALDNCDLPILTPSRASISAMRRGIVQLGRSATGASSRGATTRSAASVFTGGGPATVAFNASTPPRANSLRQRRTVSSRTLKASAMRGLVHPTTSAISPAPDQPRPGRVNGLTSAVRCAVGHPPSPEICPPRPASANHANQLHLRLSVKLEFLVARAIPTAEAWLPMKTLRSMARNGLVVLAASLLMLRSPDILTPKSSPAWVRTNPYVEVSQWLEARHLNHGIGDYWVSSIIRALTDGRVNVDAAVAWTDGRLEPYVFDADADFHSGAEAPMFVMWREGDDPFDWYHVNAKAVEATYGRPARTEYLPGGFVVVKILREPPN